MTIERNKALSALTTLQVGGPADYFTRVANEGGVREALDFAEENKLPVLVLGGGSNVLISDEGFRGIVIRNEMSGMRVEDENGESLLFVAEAGTNFDECVEHTVRQNWWGLENLSHIPGSVGATPIQNVGAYGVEVKDMIEWVEVLDMHTREVVRMKKEVCAFAYRNSFFKTDEGKRYFILRVAFRLQKHGVPNIAYKDLAQKFENNHVPTQKEVRNAVIEIRSKKFPDWHAVGTAGSFFKNPIVPEKHFAELKERYPELPGFMLDDEMVKIPLGWVLDHILNLKGYKEGNVEAFEGQALVVVARKNATANEVEHFANEIIKKVFDATKIKIEYEVTKI